VLATHLYADDQANAALFAKLDGIFADYALDQHIPGLGSAWWPTGSWSMCAAMGVQDFESHRPVTPDTLFRIASMTKAFTALTVLKLRDDGKLQLDAPAENYVPELKNWKYPTTDAPRIRVRDLLNHTTGLLPTIRGATARRRCRNRTSRNCCATASRSTARRG
jgi:CubicO group peptidase (beta-lactamase class C family)